VFVRQPFFAVFPPTGKKHHLLSVYPVNLIIYEIVIGRARHPCRAGRRKSAHPAVVAPKRRYAAPRRRKGSPYLSD